MHSGFKSARETVRVSPSMMENYVDVDLVTQPKNVTRRRGNEALQHADRLYHSTLEDEAEAISKGLPRPGRSKSADQLASSSSTSGARARTASPMMPSTGQRESPPSSHSPTRSPSPIKMDGAASDELEAVTRLRIHLRQKFGSSMAAWQNLLIASDHDIHGKAARGPRADVLTHGELKIAMSRLGVEWPRIAGIGKL